MIGDVGYMRSILTDLTHAVIEVQHGP